MLQQKEKKQTNSVAGYLLIAAGLFGISSRFVGGISWTTISIIKLIIYVIAIVGGLWIIFKKK
jgi:hypothetical protein